MFFLLKNNNFFFKCTHERLGMRVVTLLLSPRYQLFSEAKSRKIVGTEGTIKVLLPEYQVYKCFIILGIIVHHQRYWPCDSNKNLYIKFSAHTLYIHLQAHTNIPQINEFLQWYGKSILIYFLNYHDNSFIQFVRKVLFTGE
jgi:hypothetical protein